MLLMAVICNSSYYEGYYSNYHKIHLNVLLENCSGRELFDKNQYCSTDLVVLSFLFRSFYLSLISYSAPFILSLYFVLFFIYSSCFSLSFFFLSFLLPLFVILLCPIPSFPLFSYKPHCGKVTSSDRILSKCY